jgi:hypothetical protein
MNVKELFINVNGITSLKIYTVDELNWDNIDDLSNPERVDKSSLMPHNLII